MVHIGVDIIFVAYSTDTEYEQLPTLYQLDDYYACLDNTGIYCLATLELHGEPENKIYNLIQEYSQHSAKHFNHTRIERGVCVTNKCKKFIKNGGLNTNDSLELILERCLNEETKRRYNLKTQLHTVTCERHKNDWSTVDSLDYIVAAVIIILCIAIISGSYCDLHCENVDDESVGIGQKYLLCFSVFRNIKRLNQTNYNIQDSDWKGFDGVRVITEVLIVYGHVTYFFGGFTHNPHTFEEAYNNPFQRLVYSSTSIVQIFYFISGFLLIYNLQVTEGKGQLLTWTNLLRRIFNRWWRLTPPLAILTAFMATWFRHIGSGPLWKRYTTNGITSQCRTYFWAHIFYFNNYLPDDYLCALESWYVAVDIQLFILGLVVHFLIRKRSWRLQLTTLTLLLLIGIISAIVHTVMYDLDGFLMMKPEFFRMLTDKTFSGHHKWLSTNLPCYVIGMANGYFAYHLKQKKQICFKTKTGNFMSWCIIPALAYVFYVGSTFFEDGERPSLTSRVLFASCHRVVLALISTVHLLAVTFKFNGFSRYVLEWRGWQIPNKLSYCVYLINYNVLHYLTMSKTQLITFSISNLICFFFLVLVLCHILALMLHLLVESPANQLINLLMDDNKNKRKKLK